MWSFQIPSTVLGAVAKAYYQINMAGTYWQEEESGSWADEQNQCDLFLCWYRLTLYLLVYFNH